MFGAKCTQNLFDEQMYRILGDIPNCFDQRDDILIGKVNLEEHNITLKEVFQRALHFDITLDREKCQFGIKELELYVNSRTTASNQQMRKRALSQKPESKDAV